MKQLRFTPMLVCFEGPQRGERFPLKKYETYLGRSSSVEIRVDDEMASRRHARIIYANWHQPLESPECYLEDLGSRNGTELNGQVANGPQKLHERDRVLIGNTLFGFTFKDEGEMQLEKSLFELATRDALTGLDNRHQFRTHLHHHVSRGHRYDRRVSLLVMDADHFKRVNDQYGHDVGDLALMHISRVINSCCRSSELCARWGGEEFVVLLPEADSDSAVALAERIRATLEATPLRTPNQEILITISVGGTELCPGDSPEEIFRRADQQLLRAKESGRNTVFFDRNESQNRHEAELNETRDSSGLTTK